MTSFASFEAAVRAARRAEPLSPRHRAALEHPPRGIDVDRIAEPRDGYVGLDDGEAFAAHLLRCHDARIATVNRAVTTIQSKARFTPEEARRLAMEVAQLSEIPAALAEALGVSPDIAPSIAADKLEAVLCGGGQARREARVTEILAMTEGGQ